MPESSKNPKILVVDDDYSFAQYAKMLLEMKHCQAAICKDGHAAVQSAMSERPDVILMDMNLKTLKGTQAIRDLKANSATRGIPVILCSITSSRSEVQEALDSGAVSFLPKPLQPEQLMQSIQKAMGGHA